jgi:hypothetical protein
MIKYILACATLLAASGMAAADEFTDALDAAREAYQADEIQVAAEELAYASQLLQRMKTDRFAEALPEPLDGWTREVSTEEGAAMGMFGGGGVAAKATYSGEPGSFEISIMADNPAMMSVIGMFSNPQMLASMGEVVRINRQTFVKKDGELTGVIGGRVFLEASGKAPMEAMIEHVEAMDFAALNER